MRSIEKINRQKKLIELLENNPLMTDEDLAETLSVSLSTIRLDRAVLAIPELRERMRQIAEDAQCHIKSIGSAVQNIVEEKKKIIEHATATFSKNSNNGKEGKLC